jgi:hypothetical protein
MLLRLSSTMRHLPSWLYRRRLSTPSISAVRTAIVVTCSISLINQLLNDEQPILQDDSATM